MESVSTQDTGWPQVISVRAPPVPGRHRSYLNRLTVDGLVEFADAVNVLIWGNRSGSSDSHRQVRSPHFLPGFYLGDPVLGPGVRPNVDSTLYPDRRGVPSGFQGVILYLLNRPIPGGNEGNQPPENISLFAEIKSIDFS